jgi:hypothetical protein
MKTLGEVIDEVKDGGRPDYEDLRYTVVALSALHTFSFKTILDLAAKEKAGKYRPAFGLQFYAEERFKSFKAALAMPPKEYVGPSYDPDGEEAKKWRAISKNILKKVTDQMAAKLPDPNFPLNPS